MIARFLLLVFLLPACAPAFDETWGVEFKDDPQGSRLCVEDVALLEVSTVAAARWTRAVGYRWHLSCERPEVRIVRGDSSAVCGFQADGCYAYPSGDLVVGRVDDATLAHELGHHIARGGGHVDYPGVLMNADRQRSGWAITDRDVAWAVARCGDRCDRFNPEAGS